MLFYYLITVNILAFVLFGLDKFKARRGFWRISEKGLMLTALCGGSIGALFGMRLFRHKTKHKLFTIGVPLILLVQGVLLMYYFFI
ncbi:MAG: DUF1294 domain-containing protein [Bacteroidaceae bacterium]|nr:DUF1294 domain-containing protein [Bacteroidaceae bacterium]